MKKFILHTVTLCTIFVVLVFTLAFSTSIIVKNRDFKNYETESNLLIFNENEDYDIMIMGISHARNLSRHKNHLRIEKILDLKIVNIGQGEGKCGVNEQMFYLKYFYETMNFTDTIIYVLSPPLLWNQNLNQASNTFVKEPFKFDFFFKYFNFKTENKWQRLLFYIKSKLSSSWLFNTPYSLDKNEVKLIALDPLEIEKGTKLAYNGTSLQIFMQNCAVVENTIKLAHKYNSEIIFIILPTLFGKWQGHPETIDFLKKMSIKHKIKYYDYSETVTGLEYYYDHHHFNSDGIVHFVENYLKKSINKLFLPPAQ